MILKILISNIFLFIKIIANEFNEDNLCTTNFCRENSLGTYKCTEKPKSDEIGFKSPNECNCCNLNLKKLGENETCLIGSPTNIFPSNICGDNLYCEQTLNGPICKPNIQSICGRARKEWEETLERGDLGNLIEKPKCDEHGDFESVKCNSQQLCYCLNLKGLRIFGEKLYEVETGSEINCGCSRNIDKIKANLNIPQNKFKDIKTMRCLSNGNYDPIQCLDENNCLCVDELTGLPIDNSLGINIKHISNLKCLNTKIHSSIYYNDCEKEYNSLQKELINSKNDGFEIVDIILPSCEPDGFYSKVQESYTTKRCVDKYGNQIEEYKIKNNEIELFETMNCNCARLEWLLREENKEISTVCCKNGNFAQMQCRLKECFCVDIDGNQITMEEQLDNVHKLPCYNEEQILCT